MYLCRVNIALFLLTLQGQCKPNAESSLYAEVQLVLAISTAKVRQDSHENKKYGSFLFKLLRQAMCYTTKGE